MGLDETDKKLDMTLDDIVSERKQEVAATAAAAAAAGVPAGKIKNTCVAFLRLGVCVLVGRSSTNRGKRLTAATVREQEACGPDRAERAVPAAECALWSVEQLAVRCRPVLRSSLSGRLRGLCVPSMSADAGWIPVAGSCQVIGVAALVAAAAAVALGADEQSDGVWAAVVTGWECVGM
jgi:hypothetical protein